MKRSANSHDGMDPIKHVVTMTTVESCERLLVFKIYIYIGNTSTNAAFSCDFSNWSQMKNASFFRVTEDTSWQRRGAKSTSLSVHHLHCYVMTLQNIWSALYVLKHPVFPRDEITNQHGGQLWPEGLWGGFVTARLPVWLPTPSGKYVRLRGRGGGQWEALSPTFS